MYLHDAENERLPERIPFADSSLAQATHLQLLRLQGVLVRTRTLSALSWALASFVGFFWYAQFVHTIGWNVIELFIAQHLKQYGQYVTSLDYPSALTWRPIVPTLLVAAFRLTTSDPLLIYRLYAGTTFAVLSACMFLSGYRLGGKLSGHLAAALTVSCPATTSYLIRHIHSYSHLGALLVLGPTLLVSIHILRSRRDALPMRVYALAGVLWGLAYLCRTEMFLFAGAFFLALLLHRIRPRRALLAFGGSFLIFFLSYNVAADYVSARDGLWMRKSVYGFYISQGWVDPPHIDFDTEGEGYLYAIELYGGPKANHESMAIAISRNPEAFLKRVRLNISSLYEKYADDAFVPLIWSLCALLSLTLACLRVRRLRHVDPVPLLFLGSLFALTNFIVVYHIDARYLTINIPALILMAACAGPLLSRLTTRVWQARLLNLGLVALFAYSVYPHWKEVIESERSRPVGIAPMKAAGRHFRRTTHNDHDIANKEPHVSIRLPKHSPLAAEDPMLLGYFAKTAWNVNPDDGPFAHAWLAGGADGPFPRGRVYSFRDCPEDYVYVPAASARHRRLKGYTWIAETELPELGHYYLFKAVR